MFCSPAATYFAIGLISCALRHTPEAKPSSRCGVKAMSKPALTAYSRQGMKALVQASMISWVKGSHLSVEPGLWLRGAAAAAAAGTMVNSSS